MFKKPLLIIFLMFLFALTGYAQKTDTLIISNGNIITGEIKKLEYGLLT